MPGPLDIEADLAISAGPDRLHVSARGRGVVVDASSLSFVRRLPRRDGPLSQLRRLAGGLALSDQALLLRVADKPIIDLDPAQSGRWLGLLLRVRGLKLYFFNWLRARR